MHSEMHLKIIQELLEYRTATPHGLPIILKGDYKFKWSEPKENLFFLKIEIK